MLEKVKFYRKIAFIVHDTKCEQKFKLYSKYVSFAV